VSHFLSVRPGRKLTPVWAAVLGDGTISRQELLGMSRRLQPLHESFSLAGGLVGIFGAIVQIAILPMFHTGPYRAVGIAVAFELFRDDHLGHVPAPFQQLAEKVLRGLLVSLTLDDNIEHSPVLIHGPPEILACGSVSV
jgi:hypothetical protein